MNVWGIILWGMVIIGAVGTVLSMFIHIESAFNFQVIASGAAVSMIYYSIFAKRIQFLIIAAFVCTLVCLAIIWCRPIRKRKRRVIRSRLKKSFIGTSNIFAISMGIFIILSLPFSMKITGGTSESNKQNSRESVSEEVEMVYGEEYSFHANAETLIQLQPEVWSQLGVKEKKEVAECVAHCEARYLGIWTPLNVEVTDFTDKNTLGCYVDQNYTIYISEDHLKNSDAQDVLNTILHEAYHAYSHRMVDLYESSDGKMKNLLSFKETQKYVEEFENYTDGSENVTEYAVQQCEVDARRYARSGIEEYYSLIDQFLKAQKE